MGRKVVYTGEGGEEMEDSAIVQLYWDRDEGAISATAEKYGAYCARVAKNILTGGRDVEECVNDTWLQAWNAMPPHRPLALAPFLGKLTRNLSFNRWKRDRAAMRGGGELPLVLDELAECVSGRDSVEGEVDRGELTAAIDAFLGDLPREQRVLFLRRYWYAEGIARIAFREGKSEAAVTKSLSRTRQKLRTYLTERGFTL